MSLKRSFALLIIALVLAGCARGKPAASSLQPDAGAEGFYAILATTDLGVGRERFSFAVIQPDGSPLRVERLVVHFSVSLKGQFTPEGDAVAVYEPMGLPPKAQAGGGTPIPNGGQGIYLVPAFNFDRAGSWVMTIQPDKAKTPFQQPVSLEFQVAERSRTPALGDLAPDAPTPVGSTPAELEAICSAYPPDDMHQVSADQSLSAGRPFVLAFSSPSFCRSRICGPVLELVQAVEGEYRGRLDFIHVEPYDLEDLRNGGRFELVPSAKAWGLLADPWVFIVDGEGRVRAKFEGMVSMKELEAAIDHVIK